MAFAWIFLGTITGGLKEDQEVTDLPCTVNTTGFCLVQSWSGFVGVETDD